MLYSVDNYVDRCIVKVYNGAIPARGQHAMKKTLSVASLLLYFLVLPSFAFASEQVTLGTGSTFQQQIHGTLQAANSFTVSSSHSNTATLSVIFSGSLSPTSTVIAQIAQASGPPLSISPTVVSSSGWSGSCNNTATYTFSGFNLTPGTTYYILLKSAGAQISNSPQVCGSLTGNAFSAGTFILGPGFTLTSGRGYNATLTFNDPAPPVVNPGFVMISSSTVNAAAVNLANATKPTLNQAIILSVISIAVFLGFYIAQRIIEFYGSRRSKKIRKGI